MVVLLNLSSWCLMMVEQLFLAVPLGCLRFVIVVFPDHTHLLFLTHYQLSSEAWLRLEVINFLDQDVACHPTQGTYISFVCGLRLRF